MGNCFDKRNQSATCEKPNAQSTSSNKSQKVTYKDDDRMINNTVNVSAKSSIKKDHTTVTEASRNTEELQPINNLINVTIFTYKELIAATDYFRPDLILGEGGFGLVYKGVIDDNVRAGFTSTKVAVKELNPDGYQGDREWLAEVNYLGQFCHPNLVRLIGYCCEDKHRLLVYEYMACGSLDTHLFRRKNTLTWPLRIKIALDAAKGLACLHEAERPIIYRDFKTSNILLDANFNAKLSDFGLAKEGPTGDQTHVSTRVMGTYGYAAPEYIRTGHLTTKSDVFGFGVVLLEIMVGKRALDKKRPRQEQSLVDWARPLLIRTTQLLRIIDPKLQGQYSSKNAADVANLAHRCLNENPKIRPTMSEVVELLEIYNQDREQEEDSEEDSSEEDSEEDAYNIGKLESRSIFHDTRRNRRRIKSDPPPKEFDYHYCHSKPRSSADRYEKYGRSLWNEGNLYI